MKKKATLLIAALLAGSCALFAAACGGTGDDGTSTPGTSSSVPAGLAIDPDYKFADGELGEFYTPDLASIKVEGAGGSGLKVSVKDNAVTKPDGKTVKLVAGKFKPDQLGNYTVALIVSGNADVPETTKTIAVKDTTAPLITPVNAEEVPSSALIGQTVTLPAFQASDADKLSGEMRIKVLKPDATEEALSADGKTFAPTVSGTYKIVASQKDASGNEGSYTVNVTVGDAQYRENVLAYFSSPYGMVQAEAWPGHESYLSEAFVDDVTKDGIPESPEGGKKATKIKSETGNKMMYYINFSQTNLSGYDYAGMWVYNDSDKGNYIYSAYSSGILNAYLIPANSWFYYTINLNLAGVKIGGYDDRTQDITSVKYFGFQLQQDKGDGSTDNLGYTQGDSFYFTDFTLGNFSDEEKLAEFDKPYGVAMLTQFQGDRGTFYAQYSTEVKEKGADGSTMFATRKETSSFNTKLYGFKDVDETYLGKNYKMWVKNANDFAIKVNDGAGHVTTIAANSEGYAIISISATNRNESPYGAFGTTVSAANGSLPAGAKVYFGALSATETVLSTAENALTSYESLGREAYLNDYITVTRAVKADGNTDDKFFGNENLSAKLSMEKGMSTNQLRIWLDMSKTDWSEYDYVKFYVYNNTNVGFRLSDCGDSELIFPVVGIGAWTPVVIPLKADTKIYSNKSGWDNRVAQAVTGVQTLGLRLRVADGDDTWGTRDLKFSSGDIWFSAVTGGTYKAAGDDMLISLADGINAFRMARGRMINNYNVVESTEHAAENEAGTMKLYATKDFPVTDNTLTVRLQGTFYRTTVAASVKVWVYNDCNTAVTVGGTSVAAKTGQFITISTGVSVEHIEVNIAKDGGMKAGDAVYFGNVYNVKAG